MNQPGYALTAVRRRLRPGPIGPRATAALAILALALPLAYAAAATPNRYAAALVAAAAAPIAVAAGMRMPFGALLSIGFVAPPLVQFVVQGAPEGIPAAAVLPLFGVEAILLARGISSLRYARRLPLAETTFMAAILYAAAIGLAGEGDRRVWLGELAETSNLVVMLWLLRLNRIRFADLRLFAIMGHVMAAPFFAWYLFTKFGDYRLDFFLGLTATLVPLAVAVLLHTRMGMLPRCLLAVSCFAMLTATAAAGVRGTTLIALFATGLVVLFSFRRFSAVSVVSAATAVLTVLVLQPFLLGVAGKAAPEAVDRFRTATESPTLSVRLLEAQDAFAAFRERPGGHGLGAILVTRHELVYGGTGVTIEYGPTTFVHNSYAWYLAKTGVAGFLALMLILASAVFAAIRRLPTTRGGAALALAMLFAALAGAWGGPALHNVFLTQWLALAIYFAREPGEPVSSPVTREAVPPSHRVDAHAPSRERPPVR